MVYRRYRFALRVWHRVHERQERERLVGLARLPFGNCIPCWASRAAVLPGTAHPLALASHVGRAVLLYCLVLGERRALGVAV